MSADIFIGKWVEDKKEGLEQLAQAIGIADEKMEFYKNAKTEIIYSREGDEWTINVGLLGVPNGSKVFKFKLGQPYDSVNIDGTPLKSVVVFEGGSFVEQHKEVGPRGSEMKIVRTVAGETMVVNTTIKDSTMKATYVRG